LIAGCEPLPGENSKARSSIEALSTRRVTPEPVAESQSRGRKLYKHYCAICHGEDGKGDGFNSASLAVGPRDFSNPEFLRQATDEGLVQAVANGGPAVGKSVLMPPWGETLDDRQIDDVIAFLRKLAAQTKQRTEENATSVEPQ
jgi:cytochrome c oxidase cbb3-type subunit 3